MIRSKGMNGWWSTTAAPRLSIPRRPARPVSWVDSPGVSSSGRSPCHLVSRSMATGPGGHVDPQRQRLGGEHHLDQALGEQLLDRLLEQRQHAGVVAGHPAAQRLGQGVVAERVQVGRVDRGHLELEELEDLGPLGVAGEADVAGPALLEGLVAAGPGEDEVDGREQPLGLQQVDHLDPGRHPAPAYGAAVLLRPPWRPLVSRSGRHSRSPRRARAGLGTTSSPLVTNSGCSSRPIR